MPYALLRSVLSGVTKKSVTKIGKHDSKTCSKDVKLSLRLGAKSLVLLQLLADLHNRLWVWGSISYTVKSWISCFPSDTSSVGRVAPSCIGQRAHERGGRQKIDY
jgi:hypothetical protein